VPFFLWEPGTVRTKSPGLRPNCIPSGILVHPGVWPQRTLSENWGGGLCPSRGGELGPYLTQYHVGRSRRPTPNSVPSGTLIHAAVLATTDVDRKLGAPSLFGERAGSPSNTVAWAEAYLHTKWHLDASSRLARITSSSAITERPRDARVTSIHKTAKWSF